MKCRVCHSNKTKEFLNLGKQPLANKYPKNIREIKKEKNLTYLFFFVKFVVLLKLKT